MSRAIRTISTSPVTSPNAEIIRQLHAAFTATLPPEAQVDFAVPYAIVRVLVEAGQFALAAAVIEGVTVPPELEEAKAGLVAILPLEG